MSKTERIFARRVPQKPAVIHYQVIGLVAERESSTRVDSRQMKVYWLLMAGVLLLLLWPVWEFQYPSMVDYPDHLARLRILRDWSHAALLRERYEVVLKPFPNLAMELLGVFVFPGLDVAAAGKAILTLMIILFWAGCHFLGCETGDGRPVWTAAVAALLLYNSTFLLGFVNYNFSIALFLLALANWLWYRRRRSLPRMLAATALTTATYFAHLMGIGVLAVSIVFLTAIGAWRARRWRQVLWLDLVPLLPSAMLYASLGRDRGDTATIEWGSLILKARHLVVWLTTYNVKITILCLSVWALALAIALYKGRNWLHGGRPALGGLLLMLAVVFPAQQLFSGSDADARLVIPAMAVTLLFLGVNMPRFWARLAFMLVLGVMCLRVCEIRHYWMGGDALTREQLALFRPLPIGARVFPIVRLPPGVVGAKLERHLLHAAEYATVEKLIFFPQLISVIGQQPVLIRGGQDPKITTDTPRQRPGALLSTASGRPVESVPWEAIFAAYDYIYSYGVDEVFRSYLDRHCDPAGNSGKGRIYRIPKDALRRSPATAPLPSA